MTVQLNVNALIERGMDANNAEAFIAKLIEIEPSLSAMETWQRISRHILQPGDPFDVHQYVHAAVFADWDPAMGPAPAWIPDQTDSANISWLMRMVGMKTYHDLYKWSISERAAFWDTMIKRLDIRFQKRYSSVLDLTSGSEHPRWLTGAKFNIVDSCFNAPDDSPAIIYQQEDGEIQQISIADLRSLVWRVANGLVDLGLRQDDMIAIDMPMTVEAVAIFLGAVAAGCVVVTVADSFAPHEIKLRLQIAPVKCVFTQDYNLRSGKRLEIYEKLKAAEAPKTIVLPLERSLGCSLRKTDVTWEQFLSDNDEFSTVARSPTAFTGVLFSSGTTAKPKAIPWDNTTPIKSAVDG
ncbi:MAG: AMP-binding protein, partial [Planctomycetota bacterium]